MLLFGRVYHLPVRRVKYTYIENLWNPMSKRLSKVAFTVDNVPSYEMMNILDNEIAIFLFHGEENLIKEVELNSKTGVQGLVALGPLISIFALGAAMLSWYNRSKFEKKLVKDFKKIL